MRFGVLGTGTVGRTIANKLRALGYEVRMGARKAKNEKASAWAEESGAGASTGTFADAASFGEIIWNCTAGHAALEVLAAAGAENLADKVLVDVSNPLDFSKGMPPTLFTGNDDSLGERIQAAFPAVHVVKTLNTVSADIMVAPAALADGEHAIFVSGNDPGAKAQVTSLLRDGFGWRQVVDLGDICTARGTESYLALWVRLYGALGTTAFNVRIVR